MSKAYFEPNPTPSEIWGKLTPGVRVRFVSGHWTRSGINDIEPYDGEGVIVSGPVYGSVYVQVNGWNRPLCYTLGWTCFEIIG